MVELNPLKWFAKKKAEPSASGLAKKEKESEEEEKGWKELVDKEKENIEKTEARKIESPVTETPKEAEVPSKELINKMAANLVENGLASSQLSPDTKHQDLIDYLKKEFSVIVEAENLEDLLQMTDLDALDKILVYDKWAAAKKEGKKFLKKTGITAAAAATVGGILGIFTGGTAWGLLGIGLAGSTGGRAIAEIMKAGSDIWGTGKRLRLQAAKNHLIHAFEAQRAAQAVLESTEDETKYWQSAKTMIDLLYTESQKNAPESAKAVAKSKEELASYEKKWNTGTEIVALAGGLGAAGAYGLTRGVEELAQKKLEAAAKGALEINLDGDKLYHAVTKLQDGWHFILKPEDIARAQAELGADWTQWLHQVGGTVGEVGKAHISLLSEEAIKKYLSEQAFKEILTKTLPPVLAGLATANAAAWAQERIELGAKYGIDPEKQTNKEFINSQLQPILKEKLAGAKAETTAEKPEDIMDKAKVGDVFVGEYSDFGNVKVRFEIKSINKGNVTCEILDKKPDGSDYEKKQFILDLNNKAQRKAFNEKSIPWNDHKEYSYDEWQKIEKFLNEHKETIDEMKRGRKLVPREGATISSVSGLADGQEYEFYDADLKTNTARVYKKEGYKGEADLIRVRLDQLVGMIKKPKEETEKEKSEAEKARDPKEEVKKILAERIEKDEIPEEVKELAKNQIWQFNGEYYKIESFMKKKVLAFRIEKNPDGTPRRDRGRLVTIDPAKKIDMKELAETGDWPGIRG